jgi:hypothetical protein
VEQKYAETLSKMMGNLSPSGEGWGEGAARDVIRATDLAHTIVGVSTSGLNNNFTLTPALSQREREMKVRFLESRPAI